MIRIGGLLTPEFVIVVVSYYNRYMYGSLGPLGRHDRLQVGISEVSGWSQVAHQAAKCQFRHGYSNEKMRIGVRREESTLFIVTKFHGDRRSHHREISRGSGAAKALLFLLRASFLCGAT